MDSRVTIQEVKLHAVAENRAHWSAVAVACVSPHSLAGSRAIEALLGKIALHVGHKAGHSGAVICKVILANDVVGQHERPIGIIGGDIPLSRNGVSENVAIPVDLASNLAPELGLKCGIAVPDSLGHLHEGGWSETLARSLKQDLVPPVRRSPAWHHLKATSCHGINLSIT